MTWLYVTEKPKESTKNLLKEVNLAKLQISTKPVIFLYTEINRKVKGPNTNSVIHNMNTTNVH